jgi:hypothetical protein
MKEQYKINEREYTILVKDLIHSNYYHTQRNNTIDPYSACNITALNTVFDYLHINYTDDQIMEKTRTAEMKKWYHKFLEKILGTWYIEHNKMNLVWKVLEKVAIDVLKEKGSYKKCSFTRFSTIIDILNYVNDTENPVIIGTNFTPSGHIVVVIGFIQTYGKITHIILHDPYGNPLTGYKDVKGANIEIPILWANGRVSLDRGLIFY